MKRALAGAALVWAGTVAGAQLGRDVQPILDQYCVSCHMLESPQGGLILETGEAHAALVGVPSTQAPMPRVAPGDPARSYLVHKLRGTHLKAGGSGARMPFATEGPGGALAPAQIETIEAWVRAGAPDD